jgi:carboxymethylenebutenolidase
MIERIESIKAEDGQTFDGYVFLAEEGVNGAGILLLQEIFGVGEYIRHVAEKLTSLGYVVLAPDLYWRIEKGVALGHGMENLPVAMGYAERFDWEAGLTDCVSAMQHLRSLPEVRANAGVVGFCLGGSLAFEAGPSLGAVAVVSYYGSGVPAAVGRVDEITAPLLLHFGGSDPYIERDAIAEVERAVAPHSHIEIHVEEGAGHAFDNNFAPGFHHPEASERAWEKTTAFLRNHL